MIDYQAPISTDHNARRRAFWWIVCAVAGMVAGALWKLVAA